MYVFFLFFFLNEKNSMKLSLGKVALKNRKKARPKIVSNIDNKAVFHEQATQHCGV